MRIHTPRKTRSEIFERLENEHLRVTPMSSVEIHNYKQLKLYLKAKDADVTSQLIEIADKTIPESRIYLAGQPIINIYEREGRHQYDTIEMFVTAGEHEEPSYESLKRFEKGLRERNTSAKEQFYFLFDVKEELRNQGITRNQDYEATFTLQPQINPSLPVRLRTVAGIQRLFEGNYNTIHLNLMPSPYFIDNI